MISGTGGGDFRLPVQLRFYCTKFSPFYQDFPENIAKQDRFFFLRPLKIKKSVFLLKKLCNPRRIVV
jgi:hypothetical protein